jgi:hypothetical protein
MLGCTPPEPVPMTFSVTEFAPESDFAPGVEVRADGETLMVLGALHGDLCSAAPAAAAVIEDEQLTLRINFGRRTAVPCPAVVRALRYEAVLTDLEPGSYDVRVVHTARGLKRNVNEVFRQAVVIR